MSEISVNIPCEQYLKQWFVNVCGGEEPVHLRKGSPESHLLEFILLPKAAVCEAPEPSELSLNICIPTFRYKDPQSFNAISKKGAAAFLKLLRKRFDLQLWQDYASLKNVGIPKDDIVMNWMENNGIEINDRNFESVKKRLRRIEERLKAKIRVKNFRKKK